MEGRKQEIKNILKHFQSDENKRKVLEEYTMYFRLSDYFKNVEDYFNNGINKWNENFKELESYWYKNLQLRLTQILIKFNVIENYPGFWFYRQDKYYLKNYD